MTTPMQAAVRSAVDLLGSCKALADAIKANPVSVSHWQNGFRPVPPKYARSIERATGGKVSRYVIAPDVFGDPPKQRKAG
jgi:DNA-binding transcriptional regulator YdaS (Cro superfamily)